jgi:hypothetical protein
MRASRDNWHGTGWKSSFVGVQHPAHISTSVHFQVDIE